jgi:hypothetical protein
MAFSTQSTEHLIRSNLWSAKIKEVFLEDLVAMQWIDMVEDFPDGTTINIPSIGQAEVSDYAENRPVVYTAFDTGNFTFTISQYKQTGLYITNKMKQDSFYFEQLSAKFVPNMYRALAKQMEVDALKVGPDGQTASNPNTINGAAHRWIGSGTSEAIAIKDFMFATYALELAAAPMTNRVAIVDPSVEFTLKNQTNLVSLDNNPKWEGIMRDDLITGSHFSFNILGWDVYTSLNLKKSVNETITGPAGSKTSAAGVANLFFSAAPDARPFIGLVREQPHVDSEYNKDFQREEYVSTCRYGFGLWRPEALITVITDTDVVA